MRIIRLVAPIVVAGLAGLSLAGCSSISGLTTSALGGSSSQANAAPVKPAGPQVVTDPVRRAMKVGELSARAEKCGFNFDPARLRTNYLASEASGVDTALMTRMTATYDLARQTAWREVAADEGFCNATRTALIKTSLSKVLANDFVIVEEPRTESAGLFGGPSGPTTTRLNPNWAQNPAYEKPTITGPARE